MMDWYLRGYLSGTLLCVSLCASSPPLCVFAPLLQVDISALVASLRHTYNTLYR